MPLRYDVIVVGAGSAGSVVAARASEDAWRSVLLLEAGPDPRPLPDLIADPARQPALVEDARFVRTYPVRRPDGSVFPLVAGRVVGGGSAVNNLAAVRPMRRDFDDWARFGGPGWSWDAMLPLLRAIETDESMAGDALHGSSGPLRLRRQFDLDDDTNPALAALVEAAADVGLPKCHDPNGPEPFGVCSSPYSIVDGRRQTVAAAYLDPARDRPNLTIRSDTAVIRVVLDRNRVTGVEVRGPAGAETIEAGEVVVSTGVFTTPQLLTLSGIGPAATLDRLGITRHHDLDGVGSNYQDHAVVFVAFDARPAVGDDFRMPKVRLVARSRDTIEHPDLHVLVRSPVTAADGRRTLPMSIHLLDHRSRGRVETVSADPAVPPVVEPALLEDPADVAALVDGIELVERLASRPALARYYGPLVRPARGEDRRAFVLRTYGSYHHGVGTCRMGDAADAAAVVDGRLRVHGIDGLTIADASVLPTIPRANTNIAAVLVGEVAARNLRSS